jgi:hypothetical protein
MLLFPIIVSKLSLSAPVLAIIEYSERKRPSKRDECLRIMGQSIPVGSIFTYVGLEDAIYDSYAVRKSRGVNFFDRQIHDAIALLKFPH